MTLRCSSPPNYLDGPQLVSAENPFDGFVRVSIFQEYIDGLQKLSRTGIVWLFSIVFLRPVRKIELGKITDVGKG